MCPECGAAKREERRYCSRICSNRATSRKNRRNNICTIEGCGKKVKARGWCQGHYDRARWYGDPLVSVYSKGIVANEKRDRSGSRGRPPTGTTYLPTEPLLSFVDEAREEGMCPSMRQALNRFRRRDTAAFYSIDEFCCSLGFHPSLVYGDVWWDQEAMKGEVAA